MWSLFLALLLAQPPAVPGGPPAVPAAKPYVLFVQTQAYDVSGYQVVRDDSYLVKPGIYIVMPGDRFHRMLNDDIVGEIRRLERPVSLRAIPFRFGEVHRPTADDRLDPQLAEMLKGMEPYTTATMTQHTGRREIGVIWPKSRRVLENKWNVPGHLDGVQGWSSRLYKTRGVKASVFLVAQDANDPVSAITWGRSYPDVDFADVLRNAKGKVFEVRMASKENGRWQRFIAYSDPHARPQGYVRPTSKQCIECHRQAGVSAYDDAAIPGADTILSDPLPNLEAGQSVQGGYRTRL